MPEKTSIFDIRAMKEWASKQDSHMGEVDEKWNELSDTDKEAYLLLEGSSEWTDQMMRDIVETPSLIKAASLNKGLDKRVLLWIASYAARSFREKGSPHDVHMAVLENLHKGGYKLPISVLVILSHYAGDKWKMPAEIKHLHKDLLELLLAHPHTHFERLLEIVDSVGEDATYANKFINHPNSEEELWLKLSTYYVGQDAVATNPRSNKSVAVQDRLIVRSQFLPLKNLFINVPERREEIFKILVDKHEQRTLGWLESELSNPSLRWNKDLLAPLLKHDEREVRTIVIQLLSRVESPTSPEKEPRPSSRRRT